MLDKLRPVAGALCLAAAFVSFGEGFWATMCAPMEIAPQVLDSAEAHPPADPDCAHEHNDDSRRPRTPCPFAGIASFEGCMPAGVPSSPSAAPAASGYCSEAGPLADGRPEVLRADPPSPPPRA